MFADLDSVQAGRAHLKVGHGACNTAQMGDGWQAQAPHHGQLDTRRLHHAVTCRPLKGLLCSAPAGRA